MNVYKFALRVEIVNLMFDGLSEGLSRKLYETYLLWTVCVGNERHSRTMFFFSISTPNFV